MGVGGGQEFDNFSKKGCFPSFEWRKPNFTTFVPLEKHLEKSTSAPLDKILPTPMHTGM